MSQHRDGSGVWGSLLGVASPLHKMLVEKQNPPDKERQLHVFFLHITLAWLDGSYQNAAAQRRAGYMGAAQRSHWIMTWYRKHSRVRAAPRGCSSSEHLQGKQSTLGTQGHVPPPAFPRAELWHFYS